GLAGKVSLTFAAGAGSTGSTIKRSTTPGGPYSTVASNVAGGSYDDTTAPGGVTLYYVVSSSNANGEGPNSSEASAVAGILGTGVGITGYYFNEQTIINTRPAFTTQPVAVRVDPVIDFNGANDFDTGTGRPT